MKQVQLKSIVSSLLTDPVTATSVHLSTKAGICTKRFILRIAATDLSVSVRSTSPDSNG